ncbi:hypothetical protein FJTKL_12103 [Diaporthe vaccinii]|uniref:Uncharacterized protein n=1 Tax=Diaporthe vaccinii TaxID=105482 RepID=A0ABR4EFA9_9PEZI
MPHKNWTGLAVPTLSIETNDHTGGGINYGGLHPSSIAALLGKGPDVKKGERFDFKFNINGSRSSAALVVNTTKHLPHVEWSSDGGLGKLPLAGATALASKFFLQSSKGHQRSKKSLKSVENDRRRRDVAHLHGSRRRQPPNASGSRKFQEGPPTAEQKHRARENSQSTRGPSALSPPKTPQRYRDKWSRF